MYTYMYVLASLYTSAGEAAVCGCARQRRIHTCARAHARARAGCCVTLRSHAIG